jgi:deoxyribonuclease V
MRIRKLHDWDVPTKEAAKIQERLRPRLRAAPLRPWPRRVAGVDVAYVKQAGRACAAVVVFALPALEAVDEARVVVRSTFPYIPGLLTFREGPAIIAAFGKLTTRPDVVLFDGQGRAHPKGMGLAAHLGLWLGLPTVGCAKSRLVGDAQEPAPARGSRTPLRYKGRTVGAVVRTRDGVKPLYVSAGHRCTLRHAVRLTLQCCAGYRLPEPTRQAHREVTAMRRTL